MNSPIAPQLLLPAKADLVSRVPPLPDETTFSYVNRLAILTAAGNRKSVVADLFGNPAIRTERPFHAGFGYFAALFQNGEGLQPIELQQRHSMIALYAHFAAENRYRRALALIQGIRATGANEVVGQYPSRVFRVSPAICLECAHDDLKRHHGACHRRVHQVLAVSRCPDHGCELITRCPVCGAALSYDRSPELQCAYCETPFTVDEHNLKDLIRDTVDIRFAKFVQAALSERLPHVDTAQRLAVVRNRAVERIPSRSQAIGDNLARHLVKTYGREYLALLNLSPDAAPTLAWPSLLLNGRALTGDPIANCLLLASLFESVEDYLGELESMIRCDVVSEAVRPLPAAGLITIAVLKDMLRPKPLDEVASKHGIAPGALMKWVAALPGFSKRRAESGTRVTLRVQKRIILGYLEGVPNASRTQVSDAHKSAVSFVLNRDRQWLDSHLPVRANLSGAVVRSAPSSAPDEDDAMADKLRQVVAREIASLARPRRLTWSRVLGMTGMRQLPESARMGYPKCMAAADECTETVEDFCRRSLVWAQKDLERCKGACDNIIELFVHAKVGVQQVSCLEPFARRLLTESKAA